MDGFDTEEAQQILGQPLGFFSGLSPQDSDFERPGSDFHSGGSDFQRPGSDLRSGVADIRGEGEPINVFQRLVEGLTSEAESPSATTAGTSLC